MVDLKSYIRRPSCGRRRRNYHKDTQALPSLVWLYYFSRPHPHLTKTIRTTKSKGPYSVFLARGPKLISPPLSIHHQQHIKLSRKDSLPSIRGCCFRLSRKNTILAWIISLKFTFDCPLVAQRSHAHSINNPSYTVHVQTKWKQRCPENLLCWWVENFFSLGLILWTFNGEPNFSAAEDWVSDW